MNLKVGQYFYAPRGSIFRIYRVDYNDGITSASSPTGESYNTSEEARRRVYELNGWKYKTKEKRQ